MIQNIHDQPLNPHNFATIQYGTFYTAGGTENT
jgi:hypothetical protein